jgi:hypothetical protein
MYIFFISIFITNFFYLVLGKLIFNKYFEKSKNNTIESAILGIVIASFLSLLINFFFPLNLINNSIIFVAIILVFFITKNNLNSNDYLFLLASSCASFLIILYDNEYRPDAGLYHIPYVQILNENKIIIGLSNLHSRFAHISILQYLSAFNYNIFTKNNGILIPLASIISFFYIYFFNDLLEFIKKKSDISCGKLFSFIVLIYVTYKINRYSEFGNDAPAHLFLFYLVSKFIYLKNYSLKNIHFTYLYSVFLFLNKVFFIFIFLIPFYIFCKNINFKKILFSFSSLILLAWLTKNILISGCAIYPLKNTCFANLKWTDIKTVENAHTEAEAWAKAWPQNKNNNIGMEEFSKNFNWVEAWSSIHLKYIIKTLVPFLAFILFILIFLRGKKKFKRDYDFIKLDDQKYLILIIIAFFGVFSFFLKYPIYRYGYSYIILFFFIILIKIFNKINYDNFLLASKIVFSICLIIILSKQFLRIYINHDKRDFIPSHVFINAKDFNKKYTKFILNDDFSAYYSIGECYYGLAPCSHYKENIINLKVQKKNSYNILYNK